MKSKFITISALSSGLIAIVLTLGAYFSFASLVALALSSIFITLPLYYNSYKGALLCYGVGGVIAFLFTGFNYLSIVFPTYFLFFGIFPIFYLFMKSKSVNKILVSILGVVWCLILFYGGYYYYTLALNGTIIFKYDFINQLINLFLGLAGFVFYFFYTAYLTTFKKVIDGYLDRVIKK